MMISFYKSNLITMITTDIMFVMIIMMMMMLTITTVSLVDPCSNPPLDSSQCGVDFGNASCMPGQCCSKVNYK